MLIIAFVVESVERNEIDHLKGEHLHGGNDDNNLYGIEESVRK